MASGKKIIAGNKCRELILHGILETSKVVGSTFGPRGRTVAFERGDNWKITKDGVSVAKEIKFSNESKNFGATLIKEAANYANFSNGDGSTSVTILTAELCREANNLLIQGIDINDIRDGFKAGKNLVLENLKKYQKRIGSEEDLFNIAKISANNDTEIAEFITKAFAKTGDDGVVSIGTSQSRQGKTEIVFSDGFEYDRGFISSKCVNSANDQCILKDPKILLSLKPINDVELLKPIVVYCEKNKFPLIIIAPNFDEDVMAFYNEMLAKKIIQGTLILSPGTDKISIENKLNDLAISISAKIIGQDVEFSTFDVDNDFGECGQIIVTKGKTTISDSKHDKIVFNDYIAKLKAKTVLDSAEKAYSEYEIESIKERIARLTGGIATILVGALTEIELSEKRDRYEDAINAVRNTMKEGFISGAATPLLRISYSKVPRGLKPVQDLCVKTYLKALRKPAKILISSTGEDPENIVPQILKKSNDYGFDAKQAKIVNLDKTGIIDPYKIMYNNILYATNIAEQFLSIDSIILSDVPNMEIESLDSILNESEARIR
jgi:chaperonin GroEL